MSKTFLILALLYFNFTYSQKSKIIFQSNLKHNYAIGKDYYVEDAIDTTRLLFMGVIQITSSNQDAYMVSANQLLKIKTKELNGNAYRLKSFETKDTTITMLFDIYFAPNKQVDLIKENKVKNKIVIFNNIKDTLIRKVFIKNKYYRFERNKRFDYVFNTNCNVDIRLDSLSDQGFIKELEFNNNAVFMTIKPKENYYPGAVGALTFYLTNKYIHYTFERFAYINYNTGRILIEIYPLGAELK